MFLRLLSICSMAVLLQSCGFKVISDGNVGVKSTMGKVELDEYKSGLHFFAPVMTSMKEINIKEQTKEDKLSAYSSDNQIIDVAYKVNYRPESDKIAELYINQGSNFIEVILPQRVTASIKDVLGKYKATDLVQVRGEANREIKKIIDDKLSGTGINCVSFEVTNFDYDDDFETAVKNKIVAKEKAIEEQNRTVQIKEQAEQIVLQAEAEAKSIQVKAMALAKNKDIILLDAIEKWDGVLPVYMLGDKNMNLLNLGN